MDTNSKTIDREYKTTEQEREYARKYYLEHRQELDRKRRLYYRTHKHVYINDKRREENRIREKQRHAEGKDKQSATAYRKRNRKAIDKVKLHYGCMNPDCFSSKELPAYCLDYHHIDRSTKLGCVATMFGAKRIEEMRKCTVLCAICHRMETHGELDASGFRKCNVDENGDVLD